MGTTNASIYTHLVQSAIIDVLLQGVAIVYLKDVEMELLSVLSLGHTTMNPAETILSSPEEGSKLAKNWFLVYPPPPLK